MYASLTVFVEFGCGTGEASLLALAADVRAKALIWDVSAARLLKLVM
jgi:predicted nucleic acid-binding protein